MARLSRDEVVLSPLSLVDVRRVSQVFNSAFSREPGTAYCRCLAIMSDAPLLTGLVYIAVYCYPPEGTKERQLAVANTLKYRAALMRKILCDPSKHVIAASIGQELAGFSVWTPPKIEPGLRRHIPLRHRLIGALYTFYDKLVSILFPTWLQRFFASPAKVERSRRSSLMNAGDSVGLEDVIPADITARGYWTLMILGVSPDFGRRGIGSKLLEWGCARADETDRAVLVVASPAGEQLYGRRGFETVGVNTMLDKEEAEGMTQTYMIRFPASQRGRS